MSMMAYQITSLTIVHSTVYSRRRSEKTPKLRVTGLYAVNSSVTGDFRAQGACNAENVSIWWRHHDTNQIPCLHDYVCVSGCERATCTKVYHATLHPVHLSSRLHRKCRQRPMLCNNLSCGKFFQKCHALYISHTTRSLVNYADPPSKTSFNPGPLFTMRWDVLSPNHVKSRSREIGCHNDRIARKFYRHIGSPAAEVPVKFQSNLKSLNPIPTASKLHKILW